MDTAIIATADDAVFTKYAAVQAGYYDDPYISYFHGSGAFSQQELPYIQPIIKRGTHGRVMCIDRVISNFMEDNCQIVILGAGKDTNYFRHRGKKNNVVWFEVDHEIVSKNKIKTIRRQSKAFGEIHGHTITNEASNSSCHFIGHDLRESPQLLLNKLTKDHDFSLSKRTLFVVECVQMYMEESSSRRLWQHLAKQQEQNNFSIVLYDPILGLDSQFGRMMEQNLHRKRKVLSQQSSGMQTRTLEQHLDKFILSGWDFAIGCDMWTAYQYFLTKEERQKANACEFLDELEEWILIMQHYCLVLVAPSQEEATSLLQGLDPNRCQIKTKM